MTAPFDLVWPDVPAGDYQLNAQAIDESGAVTESAPVDVTVVGPPRLGRIEAQAGGIIELEFGTVTGQTYVIEYSDDLANWLQVSPPIEGNGQLQQWVDAGPPVTQSPPLNKPSRFYRLVMLP